MPDDVPKLSPCTCSRLRRATRAITQLYDDALAPAGLRVTQFALLRTLIREGPMRISALAHALLLDRTALSRNLDPLVERKWVTIAAGADARTREVTITVAGRAAIRAAEPHHRRAQRDVAARVGEDRLDLLYRTLAELEALHPAPGGASARSG